MYPRIKRSVSGDYAPAQSSDEEDASEDEMEDMAKDNVAYRVSEEGRFRKLLLTRMQSEAKHRRDSKDITDDEAGDEDAAESFSRDPVKHGSEEVSAEKMDEEDIKAHYVKDLFHDIPAPYKHPETFQRVIITAEDHEFDQEAAEACRLLLRAIKMRERHVYTKPDEYWGCFDPEEFARRYAVIKEAAARTPSGTQSNHRARRRPDLPHYPFELQPKPPLRLGVRMEKGVAIVYPRDADGQLELQKPLYCPPSADEFFEDYHEVVRMVHHGPIKSFSYRRLQLLEARFNLHMLLNQQRELAAQKSVPHRDFYNVRKVDTHVHHSACMNQKHMLRFIKSKLKRHNNDVVIFRDGRFLTLGEVFKSLSLTAYDLSVDTLDMHAGQDTFHRFDRFNLKYNPCGQSRLREIFLKTDNLIAGRYLAEVTKEVFQDLESAKYTLAEYRVSVYGRKRTEWDKLGRWYFVNRLASPNARWLIQIPRLYSIYKKTGQVETFQDMLDNIFLPLFEVTVDPTSNPPLDAFMNQIVGFDCVDDESKNESFRNRSLPDPAEWDLPHDPPFAYWLYYINANLRTLNHLRESRGMSTISFRPHAGEAGDVNHLAASFLVAEHINHGITMRKSAPLQYLHYLTQIGLAMSPLSNNKLFVNYHRNPFYTFFARGLNVSLSTDDPLLLHYTKEPLVEEYCVATQVWHLSSTDMCEIARNSVLQSGFEHPYKAHFLGEEYVTGGPEGNDIASTNVPTIRLRYRHEVLAEERAYLRRGALSHTSPDTPPPPSLKCFASTQQEQPESLPGPADFGSSPTLSALRQPGPQEQVARMTGSRRGSGASVDCRIRGPVPLYGSVSSQAPRNMRIPQPTLLDMAAQSPVAAAALAEVTGSADSWSATAAEGASAASGAAPAAEEAAATVSPAAPANVLHHVASRDRIAQGLAGLAGLAGDSLPQSK